jgi:Na+/phosphate symporter
MAAMTPLSLQAAVEALGGGGLFIFGIRIMSEGLQRIAGNYLTGQCQTEYLLHF